MLSYSDGKLLSASAQIRVSTGVLAAPSSFIKPLTLIIKVETQEVVPTTQSSRGGIKKPSPGGVLQAMTAGAAESSRRKYLGTRTGIRVSTTIPSSKGIPMPNMHVIVMMEMGFENASGVDLVTLGSGFHALSWVRHKIDCCCADSNGVTLTRSPLEWGQPHHP